MGNPAHKKEKKNISSRKPISSTIQNLTAILGLVAIFFAAYFYIEGRYVVQREFSKSQDTIQNEFELQRVRHEILDKRFQQKNYSDSLLQKRDRIFNLSNMTVSSGNDEEILQEIQSLEKDIYKIEFNIDACTTELNNLLLIKQEIEAGR